MGQFQFRREEPRRSSAQYSWEAQRQQEAERRRRAEQKAHQVEESKRRRELPDLLLADAIEKVPKEGLDTWSFGHAWADPALAVVPRQKQADLDVLEKQGVVTVRQLLSASPSWLCGLTDIPWGRVDVYRLISRWVLLGASQGAEEFLENFGWSQGAISRVSSGLAHRLADQMSGNSRFDTDEPIEVTVQMADVLPYEELVELRRDERIDLRQRHASETQAGLLQSLELSGDDITQIWLSNQFIAALRPTQIRYTAQNEAVRLINPTLPMEACVDYALARVRADQLQNTYTGQGEIVALIDSGVNDAHPDFRQSQIVHKMDYTGRGSFDEHGHGTHLAGIIGASGSTYSGAAPEATIWSYRATDQNAIGSTKAFTSAVQQVVSDAQQALGNQMIVVNCSCAVSQGSFNSPNDLELFCDTFDNQTTDAIVVVAAGNQGPDVNSITGPGGGSSVLTVGASVNRPVGFPDVVSFFTSRGPGLYNRRKPDIVAPGGFWNTEGRRYKDVSMVSSGSAGGTWDSSPELERPWWVDQEHYGASGTSQATALVSGLCALLLQDATIRSRRVTHYQVASAIKATARPLGYGKYEEGHGLIDADAALDHLRRIT